MEYYTALFLDQGAWIYNWGLVEMPNVPEDQTPTSQNPMIEEQQDISKTRLMFLKCSRQPSRDLTTHLTTSLTNMYPREFSGEINISKEVYQFLHLFRGHYYLDMSDNKIVNNINHFTIADLGGLDEAPLTYIRAICLSVETSTDTVIFDLPKRHDFWVSCRGHFGTIYSLWIEKQFDCAIHRHRIFLEVLLAALRRIPLLRINAQATLSFMMLARKRYQEAEMVLREAIDEAGLLGLPSVKRACQYSLIHTCRLSPWNSKSTTALCSMHGSILKENDMGKDGFIPVLILNILKRFAQFNLQLSPKTSLFGILVSDFINTNRDTSFPKIDFEKLVTPLDRSFFDPWVPFWHMEIWNQGESGFFTGTILLDTGSFLWHLLKRMTICYRYWNQKHDGAYIEVDTDGCIVNIIVRSW